MHRQPQLSNKRWWFLTIQRIVCMSSKSTFYFKRQISVSIRCHCNAARNSVVSTYIREFVQRNVRLFAIIDVDEINQWNGSKNGGLYKWSIISINWIQSSKLYCRFCFLLNIFLVGVINCLNWMSKWTLPFDWHLKLFSE